MSKDDLTLVSLLIHIPAVTAWVGLVMFDVFAALAPGIQNGQRARLIASTRWLTLVLLILIVATGIWQTMENPFLKVDSFSLLEKLRETTTYGKALFVKHIFVFGTVGLSFFNRFYLAHRAPTPVMAVAGGPTLVDEAASTRTLALATVLNLLVALGVLLSTARMAIELH